MVIGTKNTHNNVRASAGVVFWIFMLTLRSTDGVQYLGKFIGKLSELQHDVSGEVYAVDARTLHIKGLTYDGQGPSAFFFVGDTKIPSSAGYKLRDEQGRPDKLRRYNGESITLTLPEGKTLGNIKWLSIWCEEFSVNFGDVKIPSNFDFPRPQRIEPLSGVHGISSDEIVIVDAQTLLIPHLSYDGQAPDAKFWAGRGPKPSPQGIRIPDENGKETPLRKYDRKTVVLTLPGDLTVFDIGHFGIWCEQFTVDFGHVQIPSTINIPPSLKMLGVSPQSKLNCEILLDDRAFEVRWAVAGESIVLQLVAKLEDGEYMSFGLSGEDHASIMIGGDVVVAWVNKETFKGYADDYYLGDKSQCAGYTGSCPDQLLQDGTDTVRVLNAALVNGYSIVTYQRTLNPHDRFDRAIYTNQSQPIIWAIGPLDSRNLVSYHSKYAKGNHFIDFGRPPKWNCPNPESEQARSAARRKPKEHPHQRSEHHHQPQQKQQPQQQQAQQSQLQQQQQRVYDESPKPTEYEVPETTPQPIPSRKNQRRRGEARRRVVNNGNENQVPAQQEARAVNQEVERINPAPSTRSKQTVHLTSDELENVNNQPPPRPRQNRRRNNGERHEGRNRARHENVEREDVPEVQQRSIPTPAPVSLEKLVPWTIPPIQCYEPEDGVFYAQMGPAGSRKGYSAITGHVGWGIAWYINGLLIPEINVVRGKTYTFVTEGGDDENFNAKYHPFYITDDPVGGYAHKTAEERKKVHIFAGATQLNNGTIKPTGTGRLCHWTYKGDLDPDDYPSFGAFQRNLELKCEQGDPGIVQWTPTKMTPDVVYYQCFSHRYLGWKINVLDSCDELSQGSEFHPAILPPPAGFKETQEDDLETDASYRVESVVKLPSGSKNDPNREKNYALNNHKNITTDESRPLFDTTQTQPMYVSHPNTLNSEIITKPLFYAAFEIPNRMTPRPTPSMEPANPSVTYNKSHFKLNMLANNNSYNRQHPKPYKSRLHLISRSKGGPQHRKRSHVVKKVIKLPKDMVMSEQRQNAISKRPVLKIYKRPTSSNVNFPRSKLRPEKELTLFMTKTKEPVVELSPIQPSTEKNIDDFMLLSKYSKLQESLRKTTELPRAENINNKYVHFIPTIVPEPNTTTLEFAVNTGFNPHSIVFERGFTPIMTERGKTINEIKGPEIENESEIGMLDIPASSVANLTHKNFINHRYDDSLDNVKPYEIRKKRQKSNLGQYLPYEDSMPQSAENTKAYYLPPTGEKKKPGSDNLSSIFITYDGKKIHGLTLTSVGADNGQTVLKQKAAELLRSGPQFAPFKGDLPPLDPQIINSFGAKTQQATLNRGLETPRSGDTNRNNNGVTKLKLVPQRNKRYAHHTPEHTAEQMASAENTTHNHNNNNNNNNNSSGVKSSISVITSVFSAIVVVISYQFL